MDPQAFEHVVAAAAEVTGQSDFVVIGSQAILGSHRTVPESLLQSMEADIYPLSDPRAADLIDGALGDGSPFHLAFGYYAHGVGPETAKAPHGWQERLIMREIPPRVTSKRTAVALVPGAPRSRALKVRCRPRARLGLRSRGAEGRDRPS